VLIQDQPEPFCSRDRELRSPSRFAAANISGTHVVRLGPPCLEIADLPLRIFEADGVAGLQPADQDLATTVELLDVVVGQFSPPPFASP